MSDKVAADNSKEERGHHLLERICTLLTSHSVIHFSHLMQTANSLAKPLLLGQTEGKGEGSRQWWFDGVTDLMDRNLG